MTELITHRLMNLIGCTLHVYCLAGIMKDSTTAQISYRLAGYSGEEKALTTFKE